MCPKSATVFVRSNRHISVPKLLKKCPSEVLTQNWILERDGLPADNKPCVHQRARKMALD